MIMTPIKSLNNSNSNSQKHVSDDSERPEEVKKLASKRKSESDSVMRVYLNIGSMNIKGAKGNTSNGPLEEDQITICLYD